jgi:hypothetical protein
MSPRKRRQPGQPPDPRGGVRQGQPGQAYANRTDLNRNKQPVAAGPSQEYGQRARLERAQVAVPLPQQPQAPFVGPDQVPSFSNPTSRPQEPITAGLPFGAGRNPGPMDRPPSPTADGVGDRLRALYLAFPTPELRELLEDLEAGD